MQGLARVSQAFRVIGKEVSSCSPEPFRSKNNLPAMGGMGVGVTVGRGVLVGEMVEVGVGGVGGVAVPQAVMKINMSETIHMVFFIFSSRMIRM